MSLTLKEILLYINQRIKMNLQQNIQLLEIFSNIKEKNNEYKLYCNIKFKYCNQNYVFRYENIIEQNKDSIEKFLINYLNIFDTKFK
jgi:hypothetical protein